MTVALKPKYELFAQARAKGISQVGAALSAGYSAASADRIDNRWDVNARVKELQARRAQVGPPDLIAELEYLATLAAAGEAMGSAAGLNCARLAMTEAFRMMREAEPAGAAPARHLKPPLTEDEWFAKYPPKD